MRKDNIYIWIWTVVFVLLFFGCDSNNAPDCFKTTGDIVQQEIQLDDFTSIETLDEIDIYLSGSEEQKVIVKAGENLIPKIHLTVKNKVLTITNDNKCNWRRSPGNPGVYVYSNDLSSISIFDFSNIYTMDTLVLDNLHIYSDGTGNFDMIMNTDSLFIESIYISNFNMTGQTDFLHILFNDDSQFIGKDLKSSYCEISHFGSNRIETYPIVSLTGTVESTGSLYYYNEPDILDVMVYGTGTLIDLSN
jgi:hypothetical protein